MRLKLARWFFAFTVLVVITSITVSVWLAVTVTPTIYTYGAVHEPSEFTSVAARVATVFCYFTNVTGCIIGVVSLLLAINPMRSSPAFAVWRLISVVSAIIVEAIFNLLLAPNYTAPSALAEWANNLGDRAVPALCIIGWLVFGPRLAMSTRTVMLSLIYGLVFVAFTLVRGGLFEVPGQQNDHWYPYPFLDATVYGYPFVFAVVGGLLVVCIGLGYAVLALDKVLPGPKPPKRAQLPPAIPAAPYSHP
ncbi:MAG: Pr6Pr family membrane protein [Actinomycetes bacterium]